MEAIRGLWEAVEASGKPEEGIGRIREPEGPEGGFRSSRVWGLRGLGLRA